jgi:hypothetical protein
VRITRWNALAIALAPAIIAVACSRFDEDSPDAQDAGADASDGGSLDTGFLADGGADGPADQDADADAGPPPCVTAVFNSGDSGTIVKCPSGMVRTGCAAYCVGGKAGSVRAVALEGCQGTCINAEAKVEVYTHCARFPEAVSVRVGTGEVACDGGAIRTGCAAECADSGSSSLAVGPFGCSGSCASGTVPTVQALCAVKPAAATMIATATGGREATAVCPANTTLVDCSSECTGTNGGGTRVTDTGDCFGACDLANATAKVTAICGTNLCP